MKENKKYDIMNNEGDFMNERDAIWYLDIDGVLNRYVYTEEQKKECLEYLNQSLKDLKLDTPSLEELREVSKTSTIQLVFTLPYLFCKESLDYILSMNDCDLSEKEFTWYLKVEQVGDQYGYTITIPNRHSKLYKQYLVKHNIHKRFRISYYMDAWRAEAVEALNACYRKYRPEKVVVTSAWRIHMDRLKDWMRMYGVEIPLDILEEFVYRNSDRGLAIMEDLQRRGYPENYKVIDDETTPTYVSFGSHLIKNNMYVGLTMEDVEEKEKVKVYGN